jgi:hypothetical protein
MSEDSTRAKIWVRTAGYDALFMLSGLWAMAIVVALHGSGHLSRFHLWLGVLFWIGHRLATSYLAFCQQAYRELLVEQNKRFVIAPLVVIATVFAMMLIPESIIPIPILYRLLLLAVVDFAWEFYHFTMQHYGVISVYRILARQNPAAVKDKKIEKLFCLTVFGCAIPAAVVYQSLSNLAQANTDFFVPMWAIETLRGGGIAFVLGFTGFMVVKELNASQSSIPKTLYMISVGIPVALAFVYHSLVPALLIIAVQHWLVAVGISAHMASGHAPSNAEPNGWYRFWGVVNKSPWAVLVVMCIFSAVLVSIMEVSDVERRYAVKELRSMFDANAGTRDYIYWGETYMSWLRWLWSASEDTVLMLFVAVGFSFGYIHYLMDRAIFRFSNAATRQKSLPLLVQKN